MKVTEMNIDEVKTQTDSFDYALVYEYSNIILDKPSSFEWNWDETSEAFLFNGSAQTHIYRKDDQLRAVKLEEETGDVDYVDREYELDQKFRKTGKSIVIRDYLTPDEDGQAVVSGTRLVEIK